MSAVAEIKSLAAEAVRAAKRAELAALKAKRAGNETARRAASVEARIQRARAGAFNESLDALLRAGIN